MEPVTVGSVRAKGALPKVFVGMVKEERSGWALLTVMVKALVVAVAVLESVTPMVIAEDPAALGVPEITPVAVSRVSPEGRVPERSAKLRGVAPPEEVRERV